MSPRLLVLSSLLVAAGCGEPKLDWEGGLDTGAVGDTGPTGGDGGGGGDGGDSGGDSGGDGGDGGGPVDDDGDGFTSDEDCDDSDPEVNPDGEEGTAEGDANGKDDDCNGYVDDASVCEDETGDWTTIQEGIDEAPDGATLLVCPGLYEEDLSVLGREIAVVAIEGPDVTRIRGSGTTSTITVQGAFDGASFEGFAISGGVSVAGGGITCSQSDLGLYDNVVTGSTATYGGGFYATSCTLDVDGNTFSENEATDRGGGVYLDSSSGALSANTISHNVAVDGGGGFVRNGSVSLLENTFDQNYASNPDEETWSGRGGGGGGLFTWANVTIEGNTFSSNEAFGGAGVYLYGGSGVFEDNLVQGNTCWEDGAGLYTNQSSYDLIGNEFRENVATDDAGGARVYVGRMLVQDNSFYGNQASDDAGGLKLSHSENEIYDNYFEGNSTGDAGGGMELDNETSTASGNVFVGNSATRGAGLHAWYNEGTMTISDSEFYENYASDCGGGMQVDNMAHRLTIRNMWFENNSSGNDGAALCVDEVIQTEDDKSTWSEESYVTIQNMVAFDNDAADQGGAIYSKTGHLFVLNSTFAHNEGSVGGILLKRSTLELSSSIVANNGGYGIALFEDEGLESTATGTYNDVTGHSDDFYGTDSWDGANGNIDEDPDFVDALAGDLTLAAGSPGIDAGDPALTDPDGSRADMGAYGGPYGAW